jgi:hypothetical protein
MFLDNMMLLASAATLFIKIIVDAIRIAFPERPNWISPVLAISLGPLVVAGLIIANGDALTSQMIAQAFLSGILAGGGAIGVTELQKRSD